MRANTEQVLVKSIGNFLRGIGIATLAILQRSSTKTLHYWQILKILKWLFCKSN